MGRSIKVKAKGLLGWRIDSSQDFVNLHFFLENIPIVFTKIVHKKILFLYLHIAEQKMSNYSPRSVIKKSKKSAQKYPSLIAPEKN